MAGGPIPQHPPPPPPPTTPPPSSTVDSIMDAVFGNMQLPSLDITDVLADSWFQGFNNDNELFVNGVSSITRELESVDEQILNQLTVLSGEVQQWLHSNVPDAEPLYRQLSDQVSSITKLFHVSPSVVSVVVTLWTVSTMVSAMAMDSSDDAMVPTNKPYPTNRYDPIAAKIYFRKRLPQMISRGLEVLANSLSFAFQLLQDRIRDDTSEETENLRGQQLAKLLTTLGPTYIKVGQSLSIRTDLISPPYIRGLSTLQDQVPPYPSDIAFQMMEEEWGCPIDDVVRDITPEPIAAASLGQVYKAVLRTDGRTVAIKVQRPNIMDQIALDMHLLREVAPIIKQVGNLNSDTVGTVDAWGIGFVDELDYLQEAKNAKYFTEQIQKTPLKDVVFAPTVVEEFSTEKVLVTEWVDGERLDFSSSQDVTVLCSIAMNTYLTMLLEVGLLHCDPHPGNLLRSADDGRLCILDWGMVTRLDKDIQLTLIEHVAHLTSADYDEIPRDLLLLGFIPESKADLINDSDIVSVLAGIYGAWSSGGGAAAVNVNEVINQLQDLTATKGNLFQIPPYFAYIAKSFSVLEGIGLSNDAKYSIINECLPYISQRLLTDEQNMGPALSTFIFGPQKNNVQTRIIDYDRVEQLITGFGNYTSSAAAVALLSSSASAVARRGADTNTGEESPVTTTMTGDDAAAASTSIGDSSTASGSTSTHPTQIFLEKSADQVLDLVFAEEETPFQKILLEQLAKIIATSSRSVFTQLRESSGVLPSGRTVLGSIVDPIGLFRTSPLVRMNEQDDEIIDTTRKLFTLAQNQGLLDFSFVNDLSRQEVIQLSTILGRKVWERRIGILRTGNRLTKELLTLFADKLERGERDSRKLPPLVSSDNKKEEEDSTTSLFRKDIRSRIDIDEADPMTATARSRARIEAAKAAARKARTTTTIGRNSPRSSSSSNTETSDRLANARKLLEELNRMETQGWNGNDNDDDNDDDEDGADNDTSISSPNGTGTSTKDNNASTTTTAVPVPKAIPVSNSRY